MDKVVTYFSGDTMASDVWKSKYQMKDDNNTPLEEIPSDMHWRLARGFAEKEMYYKQIEDTLSPTVLDKLSDYGKQLMLKRRQQSLLDIEAELFSYFDHYQRLVPQGSIMSNLGNPFIVGSLSNCFTIRSPKDSYGDIMRADEELVQLMKRRGGVGMSLDHLRPAFAKVTNSARTSTGAISFAERFSNSTREVGQEGRRGALMLLLSVSHPDIFGFITMKKDRTKVTGANVSVKFTDNFMQLIDQDAPFFICRFPLEDTRDVPEESLEFNKLTCIEGSYYMKIKPMELFSTFIEMARDNAEPGAAFIDRVKDFCPDGVYEAYMPNSCNPCGEEWMADDETCRLFLQNLFNAIDSPYTSDACINEQRLYETSYILQRLGDDLVDLEIEYIDRILAKIDNDPEDEEVKRRERDLWIRIRTIAKNGRRTGSGITALGDMLAALLLRFGSDKSLMAAEEAMKIKMRAELDATIDMAITRGTFEGWDPNLQYDSNDNGTFGLNSFYQMLLEEFPGQAYREMRYGRRNVNWSTIPPAGTTSTQTQTTSGGEPVFKIMYMRRRKVNANDRITRTDFVDQNGDKWQEYYVLHPQFKYWLEHHMYLSEKSINLLTKDQLDELFKESPWYNSQAEDLNWQQRVSMQSILQKYTTNAVSSTVNLPEDVSYETVWGIYMEAWKKGLKGITVYRDKCRSGVLVDANTKKSGTFEYSNAPKRPGILEAHYYYVKYKRQKYAVVVGLLEEKPYEVFVFENPILESNIKGTVTKIRKNQYQFDSVGYTVENIQLSSSLAEERMLTRFVSMMLRHGASPEYVIHQIEKSEVTVASFGKVISRVLSQYVIDGKAHGEECPECHGKTVIRQEGCKKCTNCAYSKC